MTDRDPIETQEWLAALDSVLKYEDKARADFLIETLMRHAQTRGVSVPDALNSPYVNTVPVDAEAKLPHPTELYEKITGAIRWNAMVMVTRANEKDSSIGGHIATYGSSADLF